MDITKTPIPSQQLALSARQAAVLLGISRAQLWKLDASGKLPLPVRLGNDETGAPVVANATETGHPRGDALPKYV